MKLLPTLTFLVAFLSFWIPTIDSIDQLADFIIVPIMNAFFLTMNAATYEEAKSGCAKKAMVLAKFGKTDMNAVFGPPGSTVWISEWDTLVSKEQSKGVGITLSPNPMKPWIIHGFPSLFKSNLKYPYVCQAIKASGGPQTR